MTIGKINAAGIEVVMSEAERIKYQGFFRERKELQKTSSTTENHLRGDFLQLVFPFLEELKLIPKGIGYVDLRSRRLPGTAIVQCNDIKMGTETYDLTKHKNTHGFTYNPFVVFDLRESDLIVSESFVDAEATRVTTKVMRDIVNTAYPTSGDKINSPHIVMVEESGLPRMYVRGAQHLQPVLSRLQSV